ncbi:MAG TPA: SDR family NAD(P)-dependent oxidoreductase [Ohtaekwangia sp.]|nr:SDR family NAD(P)-dependent oxidoreductase [Ohtaekwangia sp.]
MVISILGCGWLGSALGKHLANRGDMVFGSTTSHAKCNTLQSVGIHPVLLRFAPELEGDDGSAFFDTDIIVISIPPQRKSGRSGFFLQQMNAVVQRINRGTVRKILFISSTSVYSADNKIVTEQDANPDAYLFMAENLFRENFNHTTVLRFGGLIGPERHPGKFFAGKVDVAGGDCPVNLIHQEDCIRIIDSIMQQEVWGELFNACAGFHPTKKVFYTAMSGLLNLPLPVFRNDDPAAFKLVSSAKLKQHLNFAFKHDDPLAMRDF